MMARAATTARLAVLTNDSAVDQLDTRGTPPSTPAWMKALRRLYADARRLE
jgi:hypothetical protein